MIVISQATSKDIPIIQEIANKTWPEAYGAILSDSQSVYMMNMMYSDASMLQQFNKKHLFYLAYEGDFCLGFASCENNYLSNMVTRIHKIYILPESQGKGVGKLLIEKVDALAKANHSECISLNVNKFNKALGFYKKLGFEIVNEENIEIGQGYLMEDYRMEKEI